MRHAVTFVEVLVALTLALIALGLVFSLYSSTNRMSHMSDLSAAMQEGAIAMATLQADLTQAVQKPDPLVDSAVLVRKNGFQMLRAEFLPDGSISGKLVVYRKERTGAGNFRVRRTFDGKDSQLPGLYRDVKFARLGSTAGEPYVRVTLRVATHDVPGQAAIGKASEEAVISSLVRVMGPEMVGSSVFPFSFLGLLNNIPFLKDLF